MSIIIGPSGTGKSVCIKHMVGLLMPDSGHVLVHGESVPGMKDDDLFELRKRFGLLFQDGALFESMDIFDNVALPLRQHTQKSEDEITEIDAPLNEVGLAKDVWKFPNELSGGMPSARASRSCSAQTSCYSTSRTRVSIPCARRCSAGSSSSPRGHTRGGEGEAQTVSPDVLCRDPRCAENAADR